jgi:hypothetical protein
MVETTSRNLSAIVAWDAKYSYNTWRPITAIQAAGDAGNDQVQADPTWTPFLVSPNFPEYVSGHSTFSAAAAQILFRFTGSDDFGDSAKILKGNSNIEPGLTPSDDITLSWPTFSAAADEAGLSRRFGGIHFPDGDLRGRTLGRQVGEQVWNKALSYINGL